MTYNESYDNFQFFLKEFNIYEEVNISESDTRSKIIDNLFINVLGWNESDIEREGHIPSGYFDYIFKTANFQFVLEAKKNLVEINLPKNSKNIKIKTIYSANKELFDQIRKYVIDKSLLIGVITNGHHFVISKFNNNDGIDWKENDCILFHSLEDIKLKYIEFYNLLSKESILKNQRIIITKNSNLKVGKTISNVLNLDKTYLTRNELSANLIPILNLFFSEIYSTLELDKSELLRACYVDNENIKKQISEIKSLFQDEHIVLDNRIKPAKNFPSIRKQLINEINHPLGQEINPIIIIGNKGVGKTTFINYFIQTEDSKLLSQSRPVVYVDFKNFTPQMVKDSNYVISQIINSLITSYPNLKLDEYNVLTQIYIKEISSNLKGTWLPIKNNTDELNKKKSDFLEKMIASPIEHLKAIGKYILNHLKKRLCLILDNVDQLIEDSQKELFLLSHSLSKEFSSLVIISLREGYFYKWRTQPPFDAYLSNVYHITAPNFTKVLEKRFSYLFSKYSFSDLKGESENKTIKVTPETLKKLLENINSSFFKSENLEILSFLQEFTFPNIREGLELFKTFIISAHTKLLDYMNSDLYNIPLRDFVNAIALESKLYYNKDSIIKNIFIPAKDNNNHFTKFRILYYLLQIHEQNHKDYYDNSDSYYNVFQGNGYEKIILTNELVELIEFDLIETNNFYSDTSERIEITTETQIRISSKGACYLKTLIPSFQYIDLVLQNTPILDNNFFDKLKEKFPQVESSKKRDLRKRLSSVLVFMEYLKSQSSFDYINSNSNFEAFKIDICEYIYENGLNSDVRNINYYLSKH